MADDLLIRKCQLQDCKGIFVLARQGSVQKYCSPECSRLGKKLKDKPAKARYLKTLKGKKAQEKKNANYRRKIDWNEYMRTYRQRENQDVKT